MRRLLLFLVFITGNFLCAQVGIGTDLPNPSTQLEIISSNRGILIPQVPLTGKTDQTTITAGNLESLLVYNTSVNATLAPGYYYWFENSWHRLLTEENWPDHMVFWDVTNKQLSYLDENGDVQIIKISDFETLTFLELNVDGSSLEYADEDGVVTSIDLKPIIQTNQKTVTLIDGGNTTVTSAEVGNNTEYKVNVPTATDTNLGVVKQAVENPSVLINSDGELSVAMASNNAIKEVSANYALDLDDTIILGNASAASVTIALPTANTDNKGKKFTIKKQDNNESTYVKVTGDIDGLTQLYTALPYSGWDLVSDGDQWRIVNKF